MKPGIFKSTTALAVMVSLAAPLPALSQDKGNKRIDLTQMTTAEIGKLVERCRKRAERQQKKLAAGGEVQEKSGRIAKFCQAYGTGDFDAELPGELQSASVLASVAGMTADAGAAIEAEAGAEVQAGADAQAAGDETTQQQADGTAPAQAETAAESGADANAEAEAAAAAETAAEAEAAAESAAAQEAAEAAALAEALEQEAAAQEAQAEAQDEQAEAQADQQAEAQAAQQTEAQAEQPAEEAAAEETATSAEAIAADLAQSQGDTGETADNPELVELDSQAQADAQAEAETETAAAAAADNSEGQAEVTEETVTEETVRSSDEEFETEVGADTQAAAEAPAPQANAAAEEDDSGLSDQQRNALLGLGALAIGTLLNNGGTVVSNTGDRAIVEQDGQYRVLKDDDALLRQPGSNVTTYRFQDGSTRTVVTRENGVEVETIRSAEGRVLRRTRILPDGRSVVLFDDTQKSEKVVVNELPQVQDNRRAFSGTGAVSAEDLAAALAAQEAPQVDRRFSLAQVRNIDAVRRLVPVINVDSVNFDTGSAVIRPQEAEELAALGNALRELIDRSPGEVFLIEGHTDAVGAATYNLALSDRRAETVALALTEYFDVPPENMVVQGYGESDLAVQTLDAERVNRRVAVRRITPLLGSES
ncbi:OmpA family protein [Leisingera caerulea]|uniref:OmpA family protein n=1 Tax=Leisingera caerulea TaxID=506591 RepID=A0ABY5WUT9_LEICA|nr:OmpA family protein [Leisingera caerulea]UWQ57899.1 OmpA family protein [Leisingera caerulea]